jgi:hypothetical protein
LPIATEKSSEDEVKRMSWELSVLSRQQYDALQQASYVNMSRAEANE